ncbi:hypothetical protein DY052_05880 [Apilactobacillus timberlakei]|uniref:KxYKxGKxW signal peptide domain-containing protein n=1 Tax=Apilactobacillus timberlakei TaxID=2008380 RepID=UPI0011261415|nr:KxYKxGKxW signal peptide domain-containing protein [Apilactobacillus timberlakei]TPR14952.1 hypothetical protein DY052_05880 [Apilactobacillus timberlakei]
MANKTHNEENKNRYKMYKAGKKWVFAMATVVTLSIGSQYVVNAQENNNETINNNENKTKEENNKDDDDFNFEKLNDRNKNINNPSLNNSYTNDTDNNRKEDTTNRSRSLDNPLDQSIVNLNDGKNHPGNWIDEDKFDEYIKNNPNSIPAQILNSSNQKHIDQQQKDDNEKKRVLDSQQANDDFKSSSATDSANKSADSLSTSLKDSATTAQSIAAYTEDSIAQKNSTAINNINNSMAVKDEQDSQALSDAVAKGSTDAQTIITSTSNKNSLSASVALSNANSLNQSNYEQKSNYAKKELEDKKKANDDELQSINDKITKSLNDIHNEEKKTLNEYDKNKNIIISNAKSQKDRDNKTIDDLNLDSDRIITKMVNDQKNRDNQSANETISRLDQKIEQNYNAVKEGFDKKVNQANKSAKYNSELLIRDKSNKFKDFKSLAESNYKTSKDILDELIRKSNAMEIINNQKLSAAIRDGDAKATNTLNSKSIDDSKSSSISIYKASSLAKLSNSLATYNANSLVKKINQENDSNYTSLVNSASEALKDAKSLENRIIIDGQNKITSLSNDNEANKQRNSMALSNAVKLGNSQAIQMQQSQSTRDSLSFSIALSNADSQARADSISNSINVSAAQSQANKIANDEKNTALNSADALVKKAIELENDTINNDQSNILNIKNDNRNKAIESDKKLSKVIEEGNSYAEQLEQSQSSQDSLSLSAEMSQNNKIYEKNSLDAAIVNNNEKEKSISDAKEQIQNVINNGNSRINSLKSHAKQINDSNSYNIRIKQDSLNSLSLSGEKEIQKAIANRDAKGTELAKNQYKEDMDNLQNSLSDLQEQANKDEKAINLKIKDAENTLNKIKDDYKNSQDNTNSNNFNPSSFNFAQMQFGTNLMSTNNNDENTKSNNSNKKDNKNEHNNISVNKKHVNKKHVNKKHVNKKHVNKKHVNKKHVNKKHVNKKHVNKKHVNKKHVNKKRGYTINKYYSTKDYKAGENKLVKVKHNLFAYSDKGKKRLSYGEQFKISKIFKVKNSVKIKLSNNMTIDANKDFISIVNNKR